MFGGSIDKDIEILRELAASEVRYKTNLIKVVYTVKNFLQDLVKGYILILRTFCKSIFLIVDDAYSNWSEVFSMKSITSFDTIEKLRHIFSI